MEYTIKVSVEIDSIVNTRESALYIKSMIDRSNSENVHLDFEDVEFISRSFADQMHKEKIKLIEKGILIDIVNASNSIMDMFNVVSNTHNAVDRQRQEIPVYKITNMDALSEYLYSI